MDPIFFGATVDGKGSNSLWRLGLTLSSEENLLHIPAGNEPQVPRGIFFSSPAEIKQSMLGLVVLAASFPKSSALLRPDPPIFLLPWTFRLVLAPMKTRKLINREAGC